MEKLQHNKPPFNADDAEQYISDYLHRTVEYKNKVFHKDNANRSRFDFVYSEDFCKAFGAETAIRHILEYFSHYDLGTGGGSDGKM